MQNTMMSDQIGVIFAILAMVLWGAEELFLKKAIDGLKSLTAYLINTLTGVVLQVAIVLFLFSEKIRLLTFPEFWLVLLASFIGFLGYVFLYLALEKQEVSLIASLDESWIIVSVLIAIIFLGERLSLVNTLAILVILAGAALVSLDFSKIRRIKMISGAGYEFISLIFIGTVVPLEKFVVDRIGEANAIFYLVILVVPMIFAWKLFLHQKFVRPNPKMLGIAMLSGISDGIAFVFYLLAINRATVSIVAPIVASSLVVTVILARIFLKEKMTEKQIVGTGLIMAGVLVLSVLFGG